jgi:hypothetical protein
VEHVGQKPDSVEHDDQEEEQPSAALWEFDLFIKYIT